MHTYLLFFLLFIQTGPGFSQVDPRLESLEKAAEFYKLSGMLSEEERCYMQMIALQDSLNENASRTLIFLARYHINHGHFIEGIHYSRMADSAIARLDDVTILEYHNREFMQAKMKGMVARAFRLWGYYDSALYWHRRAIAGMQAATFKSNVDIPNQWEGIGYIYILKGIYDSARFYLEKSASVREENNDWLGAGEGLDGLGYLCWQIGDEEGAVKYYRDAIEMKSRYTGTMPAYRLTSLKESQSLSYLRLGQAYASWGMNESALQEFHKSIGLCREIGNYRGEAEVLVEYGKLYAAQGNFTKAEDDLNNALQILTKIDYKEGTAEAVMVMGDLHYMAGDLSGSLEYFRQSEFLLKQTQNPGALLNAFMKSGLNLYGLKRYEQAENYLVSALNLSEKFHFYRRNMQIRKALSDLYRASGDERMALEYYSAYLALRDSINRQNTFYLLTDLQSHHNSEMQIKMLEMLEKENQVKKMALRRSNAIIAGFAGAVLLLILLAVLLTRIMRLRALRKEALSEQQLLRSRLGPEFISYSLGNIKDLITESKFKEASDYITHFSRFMQQILEGLRQELVLCRKGISMLKSFFEMMKLNRQGHFEYTIYVDDTIDQDRIKIPSFLEHVIVPGYKAEQGARYISVSLFNSGQVILISVESRGSAADHTGMSSQDLQALRMIHDRLADLEKKYRVKLSFGVTDLFNEQGITEGKKLDFYVPAVIE